MKTRDGFVQGFNAQAAVDATAQVIVAQVIIAQRVSNQAGDCLHLVALVEQITSNTGALPEQVSADAGYCSGGQPGGARSPRDRRPCRHRPAAARHGGARGAAGQTGKPGGGDGREAAQRRASRPLSAAQAGGRAGFGQIRQARGLRRFLRRGLARVQDEWSLICTVHNLLRLAAARRKLQPMMAAAA